ncbi:MAG: hypothetical protein ABSG01_03775 [Anaerolineales bacterium]|jgi:hypothetical protein
MESLKSFMGKLDPEAAAILIRSEKEAEEARRILIDELKNFRHPLRPGGYIHPFPSIDNVLDYDYSTFTEMEILKVEPTPFMQCIAILLRDAAYEICMAMYQLNEHPIVSSDHAQRTKALINRVEDVYREAMQT